MTSVSDSGNGAPRTGVIGSSRTRGDDRLPRVALVGATGHGLTHRRTIHALEQAGHLRLVGLADPRPVPDEPDAPLDGVPVLPDHRQLLERTRPDVVVVCTPPATHLPIALDVLATGADLLLEKPPVASLAEHAELLAAVRASGRACQVGFQALGSVALDRLVDRLRAGLLGTVPRIGAVGAWWRPDRYWQRSAWAGRRRLDGRPVVDGALVNPFAHAVMQVLALAEATVVPTVGVRPTLLEVERYRTSEIEVDDTTVARITLADGPSLLVAVSLRSASFVAGEIEVTGDGGTAALEYPTDRLRLPGQEAGGGWSLPLGRTPLLVNLLRHRADPAVPLICPLERTAGFTSLLEVLVEAPEPVLVPREFLRPHSEGGHTIRGIDLLLRDAVRRHALLSELSVPWATAPHRVVLSPQDGAVRSPQDGAVLPPKDRVVRKPEGDPCAS